MPLLGLVMTPVTLAAGPIVSLSILGWLAMPLSASSMYGVLRRWTSWRPAAIAGGLLYGFSPYMSAQAGAHLNLAFVPLPPLIVLAAVEVVVRRVHVRRWGWILGGLVAAQYLISTEVLAMTALMVAVCGLAMALARPRDVRPALRAAAPGLARAAGVVVVACAYPVGVMLAGPLRWHFSGTLVAQDPYRSDLLSAVLPTSTMAVAPSHWARIADSFVLTNSSENDGYLGIPLLAVCAWITVRLWRDPWIRLCALAAAVAWLLSLGPALLVRGHATGVPLPFALLTHVPLVSMVLPVRLSLLCDLFVALLVALGADRLRAPVRARPRARRRAWSVALAAVAAVAVAVTLLPRWPLGTAPVDVPAFFTSAQVDRVPERSVVLTYPYAQPGRARPMVWQAVAGMRFRILGGSAYRPSAGGDGTLFPDTLDPPAVEQFLVDEVGGLPFLPPTPVPVPDAAGMTADIRQVITRYGVSTVLVQTSAPHAAVVVAAFTRALGPPTVVSGGIAAWFDAGRPG